MGNIVTVFEGTSCCDVWLQAVHHLAVHRTACNIVLGVDRPDQLSPSDFQVKERVNDFFVQHEALPISTIATTIFPGSEYLHGGASEVYNVFPKAYGRFRENWGTYAGRMLTRSLPGSDGNSPISPLEHLINKMKHQRKSGSGRKRSIYELSVIEEDDILTEIPIYDASTDSRRTYGGPCLSHLSFKLLPEGRVILTAIYRSHYYIKRALGNLLGLAQLLTFVAREVGVKVGPLVCHSTYAVLDTEGGWSRAEVLQLIEDCKQIICSVVC